MATLADIIKKRKRKKDLEDNPNLEILEKIEELNKRIEEVAKEAEKLGEEAKKKDFELEIDDSAFEQLTGKQGDKGEMGKKGEKGDSISGKQGIPGKHGKNGSKGRIGALGERGEQGLEGKKGKDGKEGKNGKTPKHQIKNGFIRFENPDGTWGKWIRIKNEELSAKGLGGGSLVESEDLSSQCDGVNVTFTVNNVIKDVMILSGTQFPITYRKGVDFTFSGKTITLTLDNFGAPQDDQTLHVVYTR